MNICASCGSPVPPYDRQCSRCKAPVNESTDGFVGAVLDGKYLIEELLGSGGMCNVYRAKHMVMGKEVAIKALKAELAADHAIAQRFEQEARAASRVRHPHAITVTDYGIGARNTPYLVMELIDGKTIRELIIEHGPFTVERAADILRQTCGALEAAHSVGVIHRDVKPDNIIISQVDGKDWVEVVDFGVAKIQEDVNRRAYQTGANHIVGTPRYMSPEQCDDKPVDARSDIYSLGVVAYEMLTGEAPFDGNSSTQLLMAHVSQQPTPLNWKRDDLPPQISAAVMRALEKNPDLRPQSATEFARDFDRAAGITIGNRDEIQGGAFSRISVPFEKVTSATKSLQPSETTFDDEATLVRRRMADASETGSDAQLFREPRESNSYDSKADVEPAKSSRPSDTGYGAGANDKTSAALPDASLLGASLQSAPDQPALRAPAPDKTPAIRSNRQGQRKNAVALLGLFLLMMALGFILYAIFWNRSTPSDSKAARNENAPPVAEKPASGQPAPDKPATNAPVPAETAKSDAGDLQKQVTATVFNFWGALENRNLDGHMNYYAPRLKTFYLRNNVGRDAARAQVASALSSYDKLNFQFKNMEVQIDPTGKAAIATYDKSWNFDGRRRWSGTVRERLWLVKDGERWQVNGIRDLKVY